MKYNIGLEIYKQHYIECSLLYIWNMMSSFCQQNSSKINGNDGICRIKTQNIVPKENIKYNI